MKREDIRLRRAARDGDTRAMFTLASRYLAGSGMPRHIRTGLELLQPQRNSPEATELVCRLLDLHELIEHDQVDLLGIADPSDPHVACKLGVWHLLQGREEQGWRVLSTQLEGQTCPAPLADSSGTRQLAQLLVHLTVAGKSNGPAAVLAVAKRAFAQSDLERLTLMLRLALDLRTPSELTREWIYKALTLSIAQGRPLQHLDAQEMYHALEVAASRSDTRAWLILGLALCGLPCGCNRGAALVPRENLRKGTALLLRAADAGHREAWLHLHLLFANPRSSVTNPEMARFCLEKAATAGHPEAQRRLGALVLSRAKSVLEMEQGVEWLHLAATQQDVPSRELLRSLVLPVEGESQAAHRVLLRMEAADPWLAARLRLAREFGLTKQEAISIDPIAGARPWGLVTTSIPYLSHHHLSAPRVVPAVTPMAMQALQDAVSLFSRASLHDLDAAQKARSERRRLSQLGFDEALFFATAGSSERDRVRIGTRWAHHARPLLASALERQGATGH